MTDNGDIRDLVHRWVAAIRSRDLDALLADHADDIVMFDVPPPYNGVRGIEAYRASWTPFFDFIAGGAFFDVVELDITADETVAYAYALLRCGTSVELTAKPALRLRLTLGLRKVDGRWQVAHEHHSFPSVIADSHRPESQRAVPAKPRVIAANRKSTP